MATTGSVTRVLLAEADEAVQQAMVRYFTRAGWEYDVVADGKHGLEAIRKGSYDVVITEYSMPAFSGVEFIRAMRELRPNQAFIVVSDAIGREEMFACLKEGVIDLFSKPVDFEKLQRVVSRFKSGEIGASCGRRLLPFIAQSETVYSFTSEQIARAHFTLEIGEQLLRAGVISEQTKQRIDLAMDEALANSLEHGNLELLSEWKEQVDKDGLDHFTHMKQARLKDPAFGQRRIEIGVRYQPDELSISIQDQGKGFIQKVPGCERQGPVCEPAVHGRGISLITKLMDEVAYEDKGRKIVMIKRLTEES
jgi:DNA-binding response OmpR family regulator